MKTYTKAEAGAKGGSARTKAKAKASAANGAAPCHAGKTRGRPRKVTVLAAGERIPGDRLVTPVMPNGIDASNVPTLYSGPRAPVSYSGYIIHAEETTQQPTDILCRH